MAEKHLQRKKAIVEKETAFFGDTEKRKLPGNIAFNPEDIGEFGKPVKHHHHKTMIKKVHTHVLGLGTVIPQKVSRPGKVPRNIGLFGETLKPGSPEWYREMDKIVKKYTGWDSLRHMCLHTPTLRVTKNTSANEEQAIWMLRGAYTFVTGKEAYPAENWNEHALTRRKRR